LDEHFLEDVLGSELLPWMRRIMAKRRRPEVVELGEGAGVLLLDAFQQTLRVVMSGSFKIWIR